MAAVERITKEHLKNLKMPAIGIWIHPSDYPGKIIAKVYSQGIDQGITMARSNIATLLHDVSDAAEGMVFYRPGEDDPDALMGVFMK